jgi:hypothetical protein
MFNEFFEVPNLYPIIHINYISEKLSQKKLWSNLSNYGSLERKWRDYFS